MPAFLTVSKGPITDIYENLGNATLPGGTVTSVQVITALGYTPYNGALNPLGFISGITSGMVTTALGFTPLSPTGSAAGLTGLTSSQVTTALGFTPPSATGTGASGSWAISVTNSSQLGGVAAASYALASSVPVVTVTTPAMDGTASIGSTGKWADGGHVHPVDTSRLAATGTAANASQLLGSTWAAPAALGSTTPAPVNGTLGTFGSGVLVTGGTYAQQKLYFDGSGVNGVVLTAGVGTTYDLVIASRNGTQVMVVPPGQNLVAFPQGLSSSGPIDITAVGNGLKVAEGSNAKQGVATLVSGTVTMANTNVTTTSRIFLTRQGINSSTAMGELAVSARTAGTSFTITSYTPGAVTTATGDLSTIAWEIFEVG